MPHCTECYTGRENYRVVTLPRKLWLCRWVTAALSTTSSVWGPCGSLACPTRRSRCFRTQTPTTLQTLLPQLYQQKPILWKSIWFHQGRGSRALLWAEEILWGAPPNLSSVCHPHDCLREPQERYVKSLCLCVYDYPVFIITSALISSIVVFLETKIQPWGPQHI